ncbi:MAG: hypothetical protein LC131_05340, partial [Anaerolineae bacterium]|nr:hypothetical protein [Anaerolineae bacterium]
MSLSHVKTTPSDAGRKNHWLLVWAGSRWLPSRPNNLSIVQQLYNNNKDKGCAIVCQSAILA